MATVIPGPSSSSGLQIKTGMTGAPSSSDPIRAGLSHSLKSILNHSKTGGGAVREWDKPTSCWLVPFRRRCLFFERFGLSDAFRSPSSIIWSSLLAVCSVEKEADDSLTQRVWPVRWIWLLSLLGCELFWDSVSWFICRGHFLFQDPVGAEVVLFSPLGTRWVQFISRDVDADLSWTKLIGPTPTSDWRSCDSWFLVDVWFSSISRRERVKASSSSSSSVFN